MIRVLIADDQALVRGGFRMILEAQQDIEVVGEAADGLQALARARELGPDVVLMDIRMPELDGLQATRRLLHDDGTTRVLILTTFDLDEYVYEAMKAGASGFLVKDVRPEQLADAVRVVATGDTLLAPTITRRLIEQFVRRPRTHHRRTRRPLRTQRTRTRGPHTHRPRPLQRRDRPSALRHRGDDQDPRHPHPHQTQAPRPRPSRRPRLRIRARPGRRPVTAMSSSTLARTIPGQQRRCSCRATSGLSNDPRQTPAWDA